MSPREFDEWLLENNREPWGDEWLMVSVLATAIVNEIRRQLTPDIKESGLLKPDHFLPKPQEEKPKFSFAQSLAVMRAQAGV